MILVVGSTGVLGRRIIEILLRARQPVRALTRHPDRAQDLQQQGAEVLQGDLTDAASLQRACTGVTRVLATAHSLLGRGRYDSLLVDDHGHRALIDAARSQNVGRFVYISALGARPDHPIDFFRTKWSIERYLESSGLDYVILRPSAFMEWHAHKFNGESILKSGATTLLGPGTKKRNFVAAVDVARIAVRELMAESVGKRTLEIGGPGNFTNDEVAALYGELAGLSPRIRHLPRRVVRALAAVATPLHPGIGRILRVSSLPDNAYDERFDATALQRDCSFALTTLREFVSEQVAIRGQSKAK